jgi:ribosomal 30S subunit maturation factor RimM
VSGAHGVRGDVLVSPRTDFPDLRFATVLLCLPSLRNQLLTSLPAPAKPVLSCSA